jgi:hypothetical protein
MHHSSKRVLQSLCLWNNLGFRNSCFAQSKQNCANGHMLNLESECARAVWPCLPNLMHLSIVICASSDEAHLDQTLTALKFGFRCVSKPAAESQRSVKSGGSGSSDAQQEDVELRRRKVGEAESKKRAAKPTLARDIAARTAQQHVDALESARRRQKWMNDEHEKEGAKYGLGYGAAVQKSGQGHQAGNLFEGEVMQDETKSGRGKERVLTSCERERDLSAASSGDDSATYSDEKRNRSSPIILTETTSWYARDQERQKAPRDADALQAWQVRDDSPREHDRGHASASGEESPARIQGDRNRDMAGRSLGPKNRILSQEEYVVRGKRRNKKPEPLGTVPSLQSNSEGEDSERIRVYSSGRDSRGSVSPVRPHRTDTFDESSPRSMPSNKNRLSAKDLTLIDYAQRLEVYEEVGPRNPCTLLLI